ncbi:hypothetical protein D3C81_2064580 [compost metagenome]
MRLELLVLADIDRVDAVGQAGLFEEQADLVAVGGGPVVQVDHLEVSKGYLLGPETNRPALGGPGKVRGRQAPWHFLNFF